MAVITLLTILHFQRGVVEKTVSEVQKSNKSNLRCGRLLWLIIWFKTSEKS